MALITRKTSISFSMALLAMAMVFSSSEAAVNPFCNTADDKALCSSLAKDAKTWPEAMTNALKATLQKANAARSIADTVGSKLPSSLQPQTKDSIDSTCHEAYENLIDNIKSSIGFVKNDPDSSLRVYLSASSFSDCKDGLNEFGVSSPDVDQFSTEILKLTSALLAVAEKKP